VLDEGLVEVRLALVVMMVMIMVMMMVMMMLLMLTMIMMMIDVVTRLPKLFLRDAPHRALSLVVSHAMILWRA
jgi:hypothetical protein